MPAVIVVDTDDIDRPLERANVLRPPEEPSEDVVGQPQPTVEQPLQIDLRDGGERLESGAIRLRRRSN